MCGPDNFFKDNASGFAITLIKRDPELIKERQRQFFASNSTTSKVKVIKTQFEKGYDRGKTDDHMIPVKTSSKPS